MPSFLAYFSTYRLNLLISIGSNEDSLVITFGKTSSLTALKMDNWSVNPSSYLVNIESWLE